MAVAPMFFLKFLVHLVHELRNHSAIGLTFFVLRYSEILLDVTIALLFVIAVKPLLGTMKT